MLILSKLRKKLKYFLNFGIKEAMTEINENTTLEIPVRNLIGLGVSLVMVTAAYLTLETRITTIEHDIKMQMKTIEANESFVREWPLGLRGALPDDLMQNAQIKMQSEELEKVTDIARQINNLEIKLGKLEGQVSEQDKKLETLFQLWNTAQKRDN